jgi:hypothetical protein
MGNDTYLIIVTTIVAVIGLLFTVLQFRLAGKKRNDDLFNLRYEFYKSVSRMWVSTSSLENPPLDVTDLILVAERADFLFGKDISDHIFSLENKRASQDLFPDDDFSKPFYKYLILR